LRKISGIREDKFQLESFLELISTYDISSFETLKCQLLKFISSLKQQQVVLDKRQNALKVSANSMFGFLGVQNGGILPLIEGAMSITARGRELIGKVNSFLETEYSGKVVYNDTDSVMIDLNITDMKECQKWGDLLMAVISGTPEEYDDNGVYVPAKPGLFPHPLKMEFEKAMRMLCIRKKKYAAYLIDENGEFETDGKGKNYVLKKGIMIARRDNHKFSRDTYLSLLMAVLDRKDIDYSYNIVIKSIITLLRRQIQPKGNLSIIRGLGAEYKSEGYFMKVFAGELSRMGKPAEAGERLEYVVVKTQEEKLGYEVPLGKKMRTIEMWEESWDRNNLNKKGFYPPENIDSLYYIKNTMMKPLDQLFTVCYSGELKKCKAENIGYQPEYSRCKFTPIVKPAKMMCSMIEDFVKFYKKYPEFSDDEKFAAIADQIEKLPEWFKQKRFEEQQIITK
jgi:DNA polymerase elongation subunit (family B)